MPKVYTYENYLEMALVAAKSIPLLTRLNGILKLAFKPKSQINISFLNKESLTFQNQKGESVPKQKFSLREDALLNALFVSSQLKDLPAIVSVIETEKRFTCSVNDVPICAFLYGKSGNFIGSAQKYRPVKEQILTGKRQPDNQQQKTSVSLGNNLAERYFALKLPKTLESDYSSSLDTQTPKIVVKILSPSCKGIKLMEIRKKINENSIIIRKNYSRFIGTTTMFDDSRYDHDD